MAGARVSLERAIYCETSFDTSIYHAWIGIAKSKKRVRGRVDVNRHDGRMERRSLSTGWQRFGEVWVEKRQAMRVE